MVPITKKQHNYKATDYIRQVSTGLHSSTNAGFKSNAKSVKLNLLTCEEGTYGCVSDRECGVYKG